MKSMMVLAGVIAAACGRHPTGQEVSNIGSAKQPMSDTTQLARKLANDTYGPMFSYPERDETIAKIWDEPGNPAALEALIDDAAAPAKARFVAAEVLFMRDFT